MGAALDIMARKTSRKGETKSLREQALFRHGFWVARMRRWEERDGQVYWLARIVTLNIQSKGGLIVFLSDIDSAALRELIFRL